jgi:hypothetical protein
MRNPETARRGQRGGLARRRRLRSGHERDLTCRSISRRHLRRRSCSRTHLVVGKLAAYLDDGETEDRADVRRHLATCRRGRIAVSQRRRGVQLVCHRPQTARPGSSERLDALTAFDPCSLNHGRDGGRLLAGRGRTCQRQGCHYAGRREAYRRPIHGGKPVHIVSNLPQPQFVVRTPSRFRVHPTPEVNAPQDDEGRGNYYDPLFTGLRSFNTASTASRNRSHSTAKRSNDSRPLSVR